MRVCLHAVLLLITLRLGLGSGIRPEVAAHVDDDLGVAGDANCLLQRDSGMRHAGLPSATVAVGLHQSIENAPTEGRSSVKLGPTCENNKLVPQLYVLGAQNSATSSLSLDFEHLDHQALEVIAAPGTTRGQKEWNFFYAFGNTSGRSAWLNSLRACPSSSTTLLVDYSVSNLYTIPFPSDLKWSSSFGFPAHAHMGFKPLQTDCELWNTPKTIHTYSGQFSRGLKLLVMLREPLARSHSEYYHTAQYHWVEQLTKIPFQKCFGCNTNRTFVDSFAYNVKLLQQTPPEITDWFWKSFYARHIEEYLKHFDPAQFMFVPMQLYTKSRTIDFSQDLLHQLRPDIQTKGWETASHLNTHYNKPALATEMPPTAASRKAYQAAMQTENDRLARVLSEAQLGGAWLPQFSGTPGSQSHVRSWLDDNW